MGISLGHGIIILLCVGGLAAIFMLRPDTWQGFSFLPDPYREDKESTDKFGSSEGEEELQHTPVCPVGYHAVQRQDGTWDCELDYIPPSPVPPEDSPIGGWGMIKR